MKKLICFVTVIISFHCFVSAQKPDSSKIKKGYLPDLKGKLTPVVDILDIELYSQPNYDGRRGNLRLTPGGIVAPFPLSSVSFKVPAGKIVYIKKCITDIPTEEAFVVSQASVNLTGICGIRSDVLSGFGLQFNGISTIIHNNDCKRVFGEITIKVMETAPDNATQSFMPTTSGSVFRKDAFTFLPFRNENANTTPRYGNYVHNANPSVPVITTIVAGNGSVGEALGGFRVGASALRDGRVSIIVTTNLGSAHKSCDLCDDFSSNVRMREPVMQSLPVNRADVPIVINSTHRRIVLGPYQAHGNRDGWAITASGGTNIEFRVHLTATGL